MANIARLKTWNLNETLTSADLNAEFDNILSGTNNGSLDSNNIDQTDTYTWLGNHTFNSLVTHGANLTVGVDDTGHDVKFFGATTGKSWLWDESADTEIVTGNSTISGTLGVTGVLTATAQSVHTGGIQVGGNIVSDTDSTDNLGTSSVRWANLFVDSIGDTGQDLTIAATTTNLPSGHVTDYAGADVVLTHSAGVLNVSTGALQVGGVAVVTGTGFDPTSTNTFTADQTFNDSVKVTLGTGGDADLYYDGTDVVLAPSVVGTGNFVVQISSSGADPNVKGFMVESSSSAAITIGAGTTAEGMLHFADSGAPNSGRIVYDHNSNSMYFATVATERMRIDSAGAVNIVGALSKGSGSFKIRHPLPEKDGYDLVHSFIEGPQADLIYRGVVDLVGGQAIVNIDTAGRMTDGTFEALCTNVQSFTSNESNDDCVRGSVSGNVLTITSSNPLSTASISWMVIGERKDQHMINTEWTDENGRVITEPLTEIREVVV
jgi:hypothetical protein